MWKHIPLIVACGWLAACGGSGGGSGDGSGAAPVNRPPQIAGAPPIAAQVGQPYQFTPSATDPDGDALSYSIQNRPAWASFNAATGALSGTPAAPDAGSYAGIVISASDGKATASLAPFTLAVAAATSTAELAWTKPANNEDGTPLTDLAGYKIRYGTSPGTLTELVDVAGAEITSASIAGLAAGTWYFSISSYTSAGVESVPTGTVYVTF